MFYYVIVFKHESDFLRTFDLEMFHQKVFELFIPEFMGASEVEKKRIFEQYMESIKDDIDMTEVQTMTKDGYLIAKNVLNQRKTIEGKKYKERDTGRNRKKKEKLKTDFYKFQLKEIRDRNGLQATGQSGDSDKQYIDGKSNYLTPRF